MHTLALTAGFDEFMKTFGQFTIGDAVVIILAIIFLVSVYKKVGKYIIDKHEAEKQRDEKIEKALAETNKYPTYRQQSINIQHGLETRLDNIESNMATRFAQQSTIIEEMMSRLIKMEENDVRRERNKIRDRLLQSYRYYTDPEKTPHHSWTLMESEAFWEMFKDYEDAGGNGFMHSVVQPEMEKLTVIDADVIHR